MSDQKKTIVSVSEMARMCGLSRQRFHQLRGTTFPEPDYDPETKRPYYNADKQQVCLDVRQRNCGIDGKPILFYARRNDVGIPRKAKKPTTKPKPNKYAHIVEGLKALGLSATASQVDAAIKNLFPNGTKQVDDAEIVRSVFLHLQQAGNNRQEHGE
tara:strand:+ start:60472 stop:60942 length:471 start_codon:yes stop_codon:yes gene_type:complete